MGGGDAHARSAAAAASASTAGGVTGALSAAAALYVLSMVGDANAAECVRW